MLEKTKKILRNESGMSIIIVLSIGALFVALSAAVLYAASLQTASANRVLPQEDAYRMAYSFIENVLEPDIKELPDNPHPLRDFLMEHLLNPNDGYADGESYSFIADNEESNAGGVITITLRKTLQENADPVGNPPPATILNFGTATTEDIVDAFDGGVYTKYTIAMTVEVKIGGETYALTKKYRCYARYALNGNAYKRDFGKQFSEIGFPGTTVDLDGMKDGAATGYYIWLPEGGEG